MNLHTKSKRPKLESSERDDNCKEHASRKFYDLESDISNRGFPVKAIRDPDKLFKCIDENILGRDYEFSGPYYPLTALYCDYTASGKSLKFIEDFISREVLTAYGNTHTTTSVTSLQTTLFRDEARTIIRNSINASEYDSVIFVGNGTTNAIHKLIHAISLDKPVVFVGPFEHHSNLLPWREVCSEVIRIPEDRSGNVDMEILEKYLKKFENGVRPLVGCFSAASNITGAITDTNAITILLHKYNALAFWDYATAAPYLKIDMNPTHVENDMKLAYKDAIFISTHKFIGGVDTPGILVAKKSLFRNPVPSECGGGTIFFVNRENHRYLRDIETREEGGTPAIVGSIRAGMVFQLKDAVSADAILKRDEEIIKRVMNAWRNVKNLKILGNVDISRLPIFSFLIQHHQSGLYLHHNFVCAILNDVFGIQARGGCACAGPYSLDLLGIDEDLAVRIENRLVEDCRLDRVHLRRKEEHSHHEILRPGFARINFPYFMDDKTIDYVIEAIKLVCEHGWKLIPQYIMNPETGEWKHQANLVMKDRRWLSSISYANGNFEYGSRSNVNEKPFDHQKCLEKAKEVFENAGKVSMRKKLPNQSVIFDQEAQVLRSFLLPSEAQEYLVDKVLNQIHKSPFHPRKYPIDIDNSNILNGKSKLLLTDEKESVEKVDELDGIAKKFIDNIVSIYKSVEDSSEGDKCLNCGSNVTEKLEQVLMKNMNLLKNQLVEYTSLKAEKTKSEKFTTENDGMCLVKEKVESTVQTNKNKKKTGTLWCCPPKSIIKPTLLAIEQFDMIRDKDRVLVCLSGGKDSLSLLHMLRQYQFIAKKKKINFEFGAVTVDPQTESYDPSSLKEYLAKLSVPYFYEEQCIIDQAAALPEQCSSICSFCSRMKRGRIYACARRESYNVLALGQHLDDLAESFLMAAFHNGKLGTMKAHYTVKEGDLRVIRPFVFTREEQFRQFAIENNLPVVAENCPACFESPKERHRVKQLLAAQEILFPKLYSSLKAAMLPIMSINQTGVTALQIYGDHQNEDSD